MPLKFGISDRFRVTVSDLAGPNRHYYCETGEVVGVTEAGQIFWKNSRDD